MNSLYIGFVAGALTSIAAVPQVIKSFRTRQVRDIALLQPVLLAIGVGLWLIYGIVIDDYPLIISNVIPLVCNIILILMKIFYREDDRTTVADYL